MQGLVLSGTNNLFTVLGEDKVRRLCSLKGKRLKDQKGAYNALAAGDQVEYSIDPAHPERGLVNALVPRRSVFGRYNEKGRAEQALASNIDAVACITSPGLPPFRPRFIDRVAVLAEAARVPLLIVVNKCELGVTPEIEERLADYVRLGYRRILVSALRGDGLDELRSALRGRTTVFAGQSGVGKSSLLNALSPGLNRRVGEISQKYARGKHTTTMAELLILEAEDMRIIDTPGVRRLALRGIDPGILDAYFPELAQLAPQCEYGLSCTHQDESGCRIARAVDDGAILADRFESYLRIRTELATTAEYAPREGRRVLTKARGDGARRARRSSGLTGKTAGQGEQDDE
ncbi:MAG TPA: ribosome small subunit-dependent GTPase A [Rectinemataceae bacterium]|nr:ribosome small subunit-dependent GTPase A [Rectinemataceae bacterium]